LQNIRIVYYFALSLYQQKSSNHLQTSKFNIMSAAITPNHIVAVSEAYTVLGRAMKNYLSARATGCPDKTEAAGLILDAAQIAYTAARETSAKIKESESPKLVLTAVVIPAVEKLAKKQAELVAAATKPAVAKEVRDFYHAPTYTGALVEYNYWLTNFFEKCI
jgi:hypothetical protein